MQAQSIMSTTGDQVGSVRSRREQQIRRFLARIETSQNGLVRGTSAIEALELVLTHPRPPDRLQHFRRLLLQAARRSGNLDRIVELLRDAASELKEAQSLLVEADLLCVVLLEYAFELKPSMELQLDVIHAYLRYGGSLGAILSQQVPELDDSGSDGRQRGICARGMQKHVTAIAQAALRATLPGAARPLKVWSTQELLMAADAVRALYTVCRKSMRGPGMALIWPMICANSAPPSCGRSWRRRTGVACAGRWNGTRRLWRRSCSFFARRGSASERARNRARRTRVVWMRAR